MDTHEVPEWMARSKAVILGPAAGEVTLRDWLAINATGEEVARHRGAYPNPAGGSRIMYKYSIEQARYRYADAMIEARKC